MDELNQVLLKKDELDLIKQELERRRDYLKSNIVALEAQLAPLEREHITVLGVLSKLSHH